MKTLLLGNCSTLMVFPPTCSINLFATSSTISSNPNHLSSQFPRKSSIFTFLSPVHTAFRLALKSHVFAVRLTLTLTFALFFALLHPSPLSFPLRIKFPSFYDLVLYTYLKCRCCSASYVGDSPTINQGGLKEKQCILV